METIGRGIRGIAGNRILARADSPTLATVAPEAWLGGVGASPASRLKRGAHGAGVMGGGAPGGGGVAACTLWFPPTPGGGWGRKPTGGPPPVPPRAPGGPTPPGGGTPADARGE